MGRLVIAHHKSYHPYRRDNIEKVRKDEEEARLKEEKEEGRMMLADSEARIDRLRERAGALDSGRRWGKEKEKDDMAALDAQPSSSSSAVPTTGGHINLFEDLEHVLSAVNATRKKNEPVETEKGVPLAPSAKDLKPWYSEKNSERKELEEDRRKRDLAFKNINDPLTSITRQLASRPSSSSSAAASDRYRRPPPPASMHPPEVGARLTRESSERQRALDLIARKKREMQGSATPSTVRGDDDGGYADQFNRQEVREAHRGRDRRDARDRGWGSEDRGRRRGEEPRRRQW
ncbi:hypothetical protein PLICRDRAFT_114437 [Plicaturopsis crispa FD-325 SS-3]|nr:hypothetical protein PLICRDRAFT_114437 [Plicaturopsis crispa FD-325 SS-3]